MKKLNRLHEMVLKVSGSLKEAVQIYCNDCGYEGDGQVKEIAQYLRVVCPKCGGYKHIDRIEK
jgi:predicted RNA-binding Zn-ribbon protein involved in translation (DUF1610 family)